MEQEETENATPAQLAPLQHPKRIQEDAIDFVFEFGQRLDAYSRYTGELLHLGMISRIAHREIITPNQEGASAWTEVYIRDQITGNTLLRVDFMILRVEVFVEEDDDISTEEAPASSEDDEDMPDDEDDPPPDERSLIDFAVQVPTPTANDNAQLNNTIQAQTRVTFTALPASQLEPWMPPYQISGVIVSKAATGAGAVLLDLQQDDTQQIVRVNDWFKQLAPLNVFRVGVHVAGGVGMDLEARPFLRLRRDVQAETLNEIADKYNAFLEHLWERDESSETKRAAVILAFRELIFQRDNPWLRDGLDTLAVFLVNEAKSFKELAERAKRANQQVPPNFRFGNAKLEDDFVRRWAEFKKKSPRVHATIRQAFERYVDGLQHLARAYAKSVYPQPQTDPLVKDILQYVQNNSSVFSRGLNGKPFAAELSILVGHIQQLCPADADAMNVEALPFWRFRSDEQAKALSYIARLYMILLNGLWEIDQVPIQRRAGLLREVQALLPVGANNVPARMEKLVDFLVAEAVKFKATSTASFDNVKFVIADILPVWAAFKKVSTNAYDTIAHAFMLYIEQLQRMAQVYAKYDDNRTLRNVEATNILDYIVQNSRFFSRGLNGKSFVKRLGEELLDVGKQQSHQRTQPSAHASPQLRKHAAKMLHKHEWASEKQRRFFGVVGGKEEKKMYHHGSSIGEEIEVGEDIGALPSQDYRTRVKALRQLTALVQHILSTLWKEGDVSSNLRRDLHSALLALTGKWASKPLNAQLYTLHEELWREIISRKQKPTEETNFARALGIRLTVIVPLWTEARRLKDKHSVETALNAYFPALASLILAFAREDTAGKSAALAKLEQLAEPVAKALSGKPFVTVSNELEIGTPAPNYTAAQFGGKIGPITMEHLKRNTELSECLDQVLPEDRVYLRFPSVDAIARLKIEHPTIICSYIVVDDDSNKRLGYTRIQFIDNQWTSSAAFDDSRFPTFYKAVENSRIGERSMPLTQFLPFVEPYFKNAAV